jgi:hypothetical protein
LYRASCFSIVGQPFFEGALFRDLCGAFWPFLFQDADRIAHVSGDATKLFDSLFDAAFDGLLARFVHRRQPVIVACKGQSCLLVPMP